MIDLRLDYVTICINAANWPIIRFAGWQHAEWSEQVQLLHGYQPGTVTQTTDLVLPHKHPDGRIKVAATIDDITHSRGALSSRHRIIDTEGTVRWVVIIGDQFLTDDGAVIGAYGSMALPADGPSRITPAAS